MLWASRDSDGFPALWLHKPTWNARIEGWDYNPHSESTESWWGKEKYKLFSAIFPRGVKPGQCVKVGRLPIVGKAKK